MKSALRDLWRKFVPLGLRLLFRFLRRPTCYTLLENSSLAYAEDDLFTTHVAPFLSTRRFQRAYEAGAATNSWHGASIRWRVYIACWTAEHASKLDGDFVECGVNRGGLARAIVEYVDFNIQKRTFFLIDTFSGLVREYLTETEQQRGLAERYAYYETNSLEEVSSTFEEFGNVRLIKGIVPDALPTLPITRVAYLSLDMNSTIPELRAAEFFWEKMVSGAIMLLDDYGQGIHSEQQVAFDEFAGRRNVRVLCLPTGQGLIFHP